MPFALACGALGALANGFFKALTNISTGNKWNSGILGAVAGGFTYGFVSVATLGNTVVAAYASAAVESAVNNIASYIPKVAQLNGEKETRTLTSKNVLKSTADVIADTAINETLYATTGELASKIIPVNFKSWIQPKNVLKCFVGNYATKAWGQTVIQNSILWGSSTTGAISGELYDRQRRAISIMP